MKKKMIAVVLLVVGCVGLLVVKGISQPPVGSFSEPTPPQTSSSPTRGFNRVEPRSDAPPQQEWSFEQLAEALKGVRARQKELKVQETDLLAKMAEKIEEKRKDLQTAEEVLRQLQDQSGKSADAKKGSLMGASEWGNGSEKKPSSK